MQEVATRVLFTHCVGRYLPIASGSICHFEFIVWYAGFSSPLPLSTSQARVIGRDWRVPCVPSKVCGVQAQRRDSGKRDSTYDVVLALLRRARTSWTYLISISTSKLLDVEHQNLRVVCVNLCTPKNQRMYLYLRPRFLDDICTCTCYFITLLAKGIGALPTCSNSRCLKNGWKVLPTPTRTSGYPLKILQ